MNRKTLQEIGYYHKTDKSGANYGTHVFNGKTLLDTYSKFFDSIRDNNLDILEMGVLNGGSLRTWEEFFPNAKISALDVNPHVKIYESERSKIFTGSQDDPQIMQEILKEHPHGFDIVLDDASHINELTIASFNLYFDHIKPGGLYIIEDTCCAYGVEEYPSFVSDVNSWPGMNYNRPTVNYSNRRSQIDEFLAPKLKEMDMRRGNILAMHFYSETLIIEKTL